MWIMLLLYGFCYISSDQAMLLNNLLHEYDKSQNGIKLKIMEVTKILVKSMNNGNFEKIWILKVKS